MNKRTALFGRYLPLFASLLLCSTAYAASFDCRRAVHADERTICSDPYLSEQDVRLATTYSLLREQLLMGGRGALLDEQHAWLRQRQQCGADHACLKRQYTLRQQALDALYRQHVRPE